jgi:hypothetical protein
MAHGSAGEIRGALDLADAWDWQIESKQARALLDREPGLLWDSPAEARPRTRRMFHSRVPRRGPHVEPSIEHGVR